MILSTVPKVGDKSVNSTSAKDVRQTGISSSILGLNFRNAFVEFYHLIADSNLITWFPNYVNLSFTRKNNRENDLDKDVTFIMSQACDE